MSQKTEIMIKNGSDELFTIFYPNLDKETIILLHNHKDYFDILNQHFKV